MGPWIAEVSIVTSVLSIEQVVVDLDTGGAKAGLNSVFMRTSLVQVWLSKSGGSLRGKVSLSDRIPVKETPYKLKLSRNGHVRFI